MSRHPRRSVLKVAAGSAVAAAVPATRRRVAAQADPATPEAFPAASPTPTSGYAPVNGLELYYEVHGQGLPLVLLHGGLLTGAAQFGPLIPVLAPTRRLIVVDLQGHGHTADVDRPFTFEAMADDIAALIQYLDLGSADILGFSLGGGVALQTAIRHPEVVRKLVAASSPMRSDGWHPQVHAGESSMDGDALKATPLYELYAAVAPNPDDWSSTVAKLRDLLLQEYDWTADVAAIAAPMLLLFGDLDSVRPAHAVEMWQLRGGDAPGDFGNAPASQLAILPATAHSAVTSRVDLLPPILTPFLDAPLPAAG